MPAGRHYRAPHALSLLQTIASSLHAPVTRLPGWLRLARSSTRRTCGKLRILACQDLPIPQYLRAPRYLRRRAGEIAAAICRKVALANDGDAIEVWGDGEQTRSYCYIDDCVEGI